MGLDFGVVLSAVMVILTFVIVMQMGIRTAGWLFTREFHYEKMQADGTVIFAALFTVTTTGVQIAFYRWSITLYFRKRFDRGTP